MTIVMIMAESWWEVMIVVGEFFKKYFILNSNIDYRNNTANSLCLHFKAQQLGF